MFGGDWQCAVEIRWEGLPPLIMTRAAKEWFGDRVTQFEAFGRKSSHIEKPPAFRCVAMGVSRDAAHAANQIATPDTEAA